MYEILLSLGLIKDSCIISKAEMNYTINLNKSRHENLKMWPNFELMCKLSQHKTDHARVFKLMVSNLPKTNEYFNLNDQLRNYIKDAGENVNIPHGINKIHDYIDKNDGMVSELNVIS